MSSVHRDPVLAFWNLAIRIIVVFSAVVSVNGITGAAIFGAMFPASEAARLLDGVFPATLGPAADTPEEKMIAARFFAGGVCGGAIITYAVMSLSRWLGGMPPIRTALILPALWLIVLASMLYFLPSFRSRTFILECVAIELILMFVGISRVGRASHG